MIAAKLLNLTTPTPSTPFKKPSSLHSLRQDGLSSGPFQIDDYATFNSLVAATFKYGTYELASDVLIRALVSKESTSNLAIY